MTVKVPLEVSDDVAVMDPPVSVLTVPLTARRTLVKRLVDVAFVSVAFVAVRLVKSPVTAVRRFEKKFVEVALVAVKLLAVVVASVVVPVTEKEPLTDWFPWKVVVPITALVA